ncbi:MAG: hypothetical protein Q4C83_00915 [Candidatus Saccharibacteria bacterium]|nr:hypothetical protein [Candidatus Saccharibacteria bacterium]
MKTDWRYRIARIKSALFGDDIVTIAAYQHKIPKSIRVHINHGRDGVVTAVVNELDGKKIGHGFATQAKNDEDLIKMINYALQTYLDIPPEVCVSMPLLVPEGYSKNKKLSKQTKLCRA